jgi:hypothetical protein
VARQLIEQGFQARALAGGYHAWRERFPVEPRAEERESRIQAERKAQSALNIQN